jgi:tetratricopeptide (TPR) repeat protein
MRLLLIAFLGLATACAANREARASQPIDTPPAGAEPVVFLEIPPNPPRVEPEPAEAASPSAHDPSEEQRDHAKRLFQAGVQLYEAGDIAGALEKFGEAYVYAPLPALLFNIARAQEQLGDVAGACQTYKTLRADPEASDSMRDSTIERITALKCP